MHEKKCKNDKLRVVFVMCLLLFFFFLKGLCVVTVSSEVIACWLQLYW